VDITTHVGPDGALTWTPPGSGVWKIVRIGHTSTGSFNVTGHPAGRGLECDKLSAKAAQIQFNGWLGELSRRLGKTSASKALSTMHVDSWECGTQNWSRDFPEEFRKRRGYNILDYLPVMAGVPVERAETCDRVLTDVRRTIAGATQDNFYGEMARLSRLAGFDFSAESANPIYPVDPLAMAKYVDCPMGEFWTKGDDKPSDVAEAIHGGHIYGRRVIGGEAFTEFAMDWNETPFSCKVLGDANWAKGINKLTCHVWASQPWVDAAHEPGMTLEDIGVFFSRTNVWYDMAKPWVTYMSRTQALLQQGRPIIDVACYLGENIPVRAYVPSDTSLPIPEGYNFDSINTDALMNPVQIEGGAIVLPSGQRYAVLLMPRSYGITPQVLNRIDELVRLGATVVGLPPNGPIGLEGGPEAAAEIAKLSTSLWGTETGLKRHGNGWIGRTEDLKSLLLDRIAGPDCLIEAPAPSPGWASPFMWTHRQGLDWDLYFISNQTNAAQEVRVQFRVVNRTATLWDADSGEMKLLQQQPVAGGTEVTIPFDPCGAAIVIFRKNADATRSNFSPNGSEVAVSGPWKVTFQRTRPTPKTVELRSLESWSKSSDPDIRYYSGIAIYETRFTLSESASAGWQLDLGEVADLCEVELNGRVLRQMWKPPFQVNLSDAARPGENRLVVRVVNTWRNRLVGDADLPAHERQSFTVTPFFSKAHRSENGPSGSRAITTTNSNGIFLGGGFGNDSLAVPLRGSPAGTPPPTLKGISRYRFPGGGSSAPGPDVRRLPDEDGLLISGLLGPVRLIGMSAD
jgi:hypothetical protein